MTAAGISATPPWLTRASAFLLLSVLALATLTVSLPAWTADAWYASVFLLAALWAVAYAVRPFPIELPAVSLPLLGAALLGLLQLVSGISVYRFETRRAAMGWIAYAVLVVIAAQLLRSPQARTVFLQVAAAGSAGLAVIGGLQLATRSNRILWIIEAPFAENIAGPFANRDHFCSMLELGLPIAVFLAVRRNRDSLLYAVCAGLMLAAGAISESRAGALLLLAEAIVVAVLAVRRENRATNWRYVVAAAGLGIALAFAVSGTTLIDRFRSRDPFALRREMLQSTLAMIHDRPLTGFGLGTWPEAYPGYAVMDPGLYVNHAHNDWAEWTAEGGVCMLVLLVGLIGWTVYAGLRTVWGFGVAVVFLHACVDFPLQKTAVFAMAAVLLGAMAASLARPALKPPEPAS